MKPEDSALVAQLCAARAGLNIDPDKTYLLESRLAPLARRENFGSIPELITALRASRDDRLAWALVEAMASSETEFFRDRQPFALFRDDVLPTLARMRSGQPIRIWSAACGTGQEAYSLAMVVEDQRALHPGLSVEIFGSDLSERALEKAQSGLYTQFEIQRGLPVRQLVQHFEKAEENWQLSPRIRQMVRWRRVNLASELNTTGRFDVIFCRYVLSAMVEPMRQRVLENMARALTPDGFLFLGQNETVNALDDAFQPVSGRPGLYARNPAYQIAA